MSTGKYDQSDYDIPSSHTPGGSPVDLNFRGMGVPRSTMPACDAALAEFAGVMDAQEISGLVVVGETVDIERYDAQKGIVEAASDNAPPMTWNVRGKGIPDATVKRGDSY